MENAEHIGTYFELTEDQNRRLATYMKLLTEWNTKINLVSRKDIGNIEVNHILHSLSIANFCHLDKPGTRVLDLGCGGGLPGIPLAIMWPQVEFRLIDARRKKIDVVSSIIEELHLDNCRAVHTRAEEEQKRGYDFVVSRAVSSLDQLVTWAKPLIKKKGVHALPNGLICLKGGDIESEIEGIAKKEYVDYEPIENFFDEPYFQDKYVVYVQLG